MRLLRTKDSDRKDWTPSLCTHHGQPYAILSHRWLEDANHEVSFADIEIIDEFAIRKSSATYTEVVKNAQYAGTRPNDKLGFCKLQGATQQALKDGYEYIWVDTCCIDKNSSAELSEAINSMWTWYSSSNVCYVYLADMPDNASDSDTSSFAKSQWWTRGWTLQELLAPKELAFFSSDWTLIGHKRHMNVAISSITGIDANVINGTLTLESISIAQRMSWVSTRTTTRIEDIAYCLMGLFNVNMPLLYGEGEKAFIRLQQEIMTNSDDETIFAWRDESIGPHVYSGLLATRPSAFARSGRVVRYQDAEGRAPYSMTNKGLSISLRLARARDGLFSAMLHCADPELSEGQICIFLKKLSEASEQYARISCHGWTSRETVDYAKARPIFLQQYHNQQPAYEELNPFKRSIRLLRIIPTADNWTVRLKLMEADVETAKYTAVSYVWDPSGQQRNVWVNSELFCVNENLFRFLQNARQEFTDELFWVDAICIQQAHTAEKIHQIGIMKQIYGCATKVVVWLGDQPQNHASSQLSMIDRLPDPYVNLPTYLPTLLSITTHPYWTRAWSVQEFLLARDVVIKLSNSNVSIAMLESMCRDARLAIQQLDPSFMDGLLAVDRRLQLLRDKKQCNAAASGDPQFNFERLLRNFQFQRCLDWHDRIYSLVGISDLSDKLHVDYGATRNEVFFSVISCLGKNLTITILPLLLQILEIGPKDLQLEIDKVRNQELIIDFEQIAYTSLNPNAQHDSSINRLFTGDPAADGSPFDQVQGTQFDKGLVFTKADSDDDFSLDVQQIKYYLSHVYSRTECGYHLMDIPKWASEHAPTRIHVMSDHSVNSTLRLSIQADKKGIIALGWCSMLPIQSFKMGFRAEEW